MPVSIFAGILISLLHRIGRLVADRDKTSTGRGASVFYEQDRAARSSEIRASPDPATDIVGAGRGLERTDGHDGFMDRRDTT